MRPLLRLRDRLGSPRTPRWAALVAMLLVLPSLFGGLAFDDYLQRMRATGADPLGGGRFDLFAFCWGADDLALGKRLGAFPWFMEDGARAAFFRPLASLTHVIDYNLWPGLPWLMHAESIALYGLAVWAVATLYRRLVAREPTPAASGTAGLAALLYALDDAHGVPVSFLANRNALLALAFGTAALVVHDRHRRDAWRPGALLGPLLLFAALASAEASFGAVAYFVAYALCLERGSWWRRAASVGPHLGVVVAWQLLYRSLGYGVQGSSLYIDPARETLAYLAHLPARALALLLSALASPPADLWNLLPERTQPALVALALVVVGATAWVAAPLVRRDPVARFFCVGLLLALAPICATFPSDRVLFFVGIGGFGLIAQCLSALAEGSGTRARRATAEHRQVRSLETAASALGAVWLVLHLIVAPLVKPIASYALRLADDLLRESTASLSPPGDLADGNVILLTSPSFLLSAYRFGVARGPDEWRPARHNVLSLGLDGVHLERLDASTLALRPRGWFLAELSCAAFRSDANPLRLGDRVEMDDFTAVVTEVDRRGRPSVVAFRFRRPLEELGFRWLAWDGGRFVDAALPAIGGSASLGRDRGAAWLPDEAR